MRLAGAIVVVVAGVLTGVLELLLATVRVGGQLVGVSVLLAVGANIVLSWFAYEAVGRRWAVALPAVPWFVLMAVAAVRTNEGDLLLAGDNWVGAGHDRGRRDDLRGDGLPADPRPAAAARRRRRLLRPAG